MRYVDPSGRIIPLAAFLPAAAAAVAPAATAAAEATLVAGGAIALGAAAQYVGPEDILWAIPGVGPMAQLLDSLGELCPPWVMNENSKEPAGPPNPNGRNGGQAHQDKIQERADQLEAEGHEITAGGRRLPEKAVTTPEGKVRYPDISTISPSGESYHENVGRSKNNGDPIAREQRALGDIGRATGTKPGFTPYD